MAMLGPGSAHAETVTYTLLNGDSVTGELVDDESNSDVRVLIHPQLGRLEIAVSSIKPKKKDPLWKTNINAGFNGSGTDGSDTFNGSLTVGSRYLDDNQSLKFAAGFNYDRENDKGKSPKITTKKSTVGINYERFLTPSLNLYASTDYNYDYTKTAGVNAVNGSFGVGFPLIKNDSTKLTLSVGPAVIWSGGGDECDDNEYCGNTYAGSNLSADFSWTPNKSLRFGVQNKFGVAFASSLEPTNSFTANVKFYPSIHSGLFTSLQLQSIYKAMTSPTISNTVTGQVGIEF